ncbi:uncharacterized protein E5676_scaffold255G007070 [Cucumis melo var. makuwa]|uniref:Uncharacterized protein n=1 Tax=Cucumis melo var. makuwa TaxID=1194695 RepID=A0A5D3CS74_CUCMM|nr:uncharacterized protein E5676_scaffold255G007070 [Cucumis melo var. makuwa]
MSNPKDEGKKEFSFIPSSISHHIKAKADNPLCIIFFLSHQSFTSTTEEEKCSIEELNAGRLCDWFLKDKLKREQNLDSAVLQWDDSDPLF